MSPVPSASLYMTLLSVLLSVSAGQTIITADPGQNVSLPCKALNNDPVRVVEWIRTDMEEDEYVLLYRDKQLDPEDQHPSYKNRVDLQDRQMKDGDVSLILNNVTTEDSGTYECRVVQRKTNRRKRAILKSDPISIIRLEVVPPGHTDERKEDRGDKEGGDKNASVGLIVAVVFLVGIVLVGSGVGFLISRIRKHQYCPPPDHSADPQQLSQIKNVSDQCPAEL